MVAAAIIGGAVVAGVGSAVAGGEAAGATKSAANTAAGEQQWALEQQEGQEAPYTALGSSAIGQYKNLLGIGGSPASELNALELTPGYQFTKQQGDQGILNAASAGGGFSGNTATALDQYNTGLADQTYQQALQNAQSAVTIGQNAASNTGSAIANAGNNLSSIATNAGNNLANIDIGEAAGISNAIGSGTNAYTENQTIGALLNGGGGGGNTYTSQYSPGGGAGGGVDFVSDGYGEN